MSRLQRIAPIITANIKQPLSTLLQDDFTDIPNKTILTGHTSPTGQTWDRLGIGTESFTITNRKLYMSTATNQENRVNIGAVYTSVSMWTQNIQGAELFVYVRYKNSRNYYRIRLKASTITIERSDPNYNYENIILASVNDYTYTTNSNTILIETIDEGTSQVNIKVSINNIMIINYYDTTYKHDGTYLVIHTPGSNIFGIDDILVRG